MKSDHSIEDAEANYFAMCLLMPEDLVRAEMKRVGAIDLADDSKNEALTKLCKTFRVSASLMVLRLGQLGYFGKSAATFFDL